MVLVPSSTLALPARLPLFRGFRSKFPVLRFRSSAAADLLQSDAWTCTHRARRALPAGAKTVAGEGRRSRAAMTHTAPVNAAALPNISNEAAQVRTHTLRKPV
jgi:hypothetical protein